MALLNPGKEHRFTPALVVVLALAILGGAILLGTDRLRSSIRGQMVSRDGEILHAVAQARQLSGASPDGPALAPRDQAADLELVLELSRLKEGVLAVRLFDDHGRLVTAFPPYVTEAALSAATLSRLERLEPASFYQAGARLSDFILDPSESGTPAAVPLLEVNIPLHDRAGKRLTGAAQLLLDGQALRVEFERLDRHLREQALLAFIVGGGLLAGALVWAFQRLARSHALLRQHTERLLQANRELTIAVKTGALGAITAHLVHGLRQPLGNLQEFVGRHAAQRDGIGEEDWQQALEATRRIQRLVQDIVRILGEAQGSDQYEISFAELAEIVAAQARPQAEAAGVRFVAEATAAGQLTNQHANVVLLILENLVANAIQATPSGRFVRLGMQAREGGVVCEVRDEGPGIPPALLRVLFTPCRSTKGGSGLGLAISRQLALQLGARLELARSDASGTVFALSLPAVLSDCLAR